MATEGGVLGVIRAARPRFRWPHDPLAFAVHAAFLAAGHSLTAVGSLVDSSPQEASEEDVGVDGWNDTEGAYAFRYASPNGQSITVKCISINGVLMADVAPGDCATAQPLNLEMKVSDYITNIDGGEVGYGQLYKNLQHLVGLLNSHILSKLSEGKQPADAASLKTLKDGEKQEPDDVRFSTPESAASDENPKIPGVACPPVIPAFDDRFPGLGAGVFPVGINTGPAGGMLLGPNDPRWGMNIGPNRRPQFPDSGMEGIPPGVRFDPFGPPGVPGFEPGRFIRRPPGSGAHPDLEHFPPF